MVLPAALVPTLPRYHPALTQRVDLPTHLDLYRRMIGLERLPLADAASQHPHSQIETTSLDLRILITRPHLQTVVMPSGFRNIPRPSSVICARNDLLALITFALIFAPTPTSVHSCVQCAGKPLRANTIESATKDFIPERRSSFARESLNKAASGDVAAVLPVPTR